MKVALIGGTGFVGSYLIDELIKNEHTPRLLVRKNSDYKVMQSDKCEIITGDIDSDNALKETLDDGDLVSLNCFKNGKDEAIGISDEIESCLLYTSPSPRDRG